jgi:NAD-dependent dihydropyrimidine dehydrogenase PreA subunit
MIVDQKLCGGCGICVRACPNNAILLKEGKAFIDQEKCSSCQVCAEVCPTGALQLEKMITPHKVEKPQPIEILNPQAAKVSYPERASWGLTALAVAGQYVLPRLVGILGTLLEKHLSPSIPERSSLVKNSVDFRPYRLRRQRRGRFL